MRVHRSLSRTICVIAVALVATALTGCAPGASTPSANSASASDEAAAHSKVTDDVSDALAHTLDTSGVPGGVVVVTGVTEDDIVVRLGARDLEVSEPDATDHASAEPVLPDTRFAYRSITKSFVGTVILQLADSGELTLTDPVSTYVPGVPGGDQVTLEHLATMRSGVANYSAVPEFADVFLADPSRDPDTSELLALAYAHPLNFEPGSAYEYSNTNTLLLGEVIAAVTDMSWQDAVHERVLDPLAITGVQQEFDFSGDDPIAYGFQLASGEPVERLPSVPPGWFGAAGALTGTAEDLAVWGRALGSGTLISDNSREYQRELLGSTADDPYSPEYDRYGFTLGELEGWVGHTGNGLGYQSLTMHHEATDRTVAILLNGTGENGDVPADLFRELSGLLPAE